MDGTQDDMLWEEEEINSPNDEDDESNNSEDDANPYDDNLTRETWEELLMKFRFWMITTVYNISENVVTSFCVHPAGALLSGLE